MLETEQLCVCGDREAVTYCDSCQERSCKKCLKPATNPINNMEYEVCLGCLEAIQEIDENTKKAKRLQVVMKNLNKYLEDSNIIKIALSQDFESELYKAIEKIAQVRGILKNILAEGE